MIHGVRTDQVLVLLHSLVSDRGVIAAAEQIVAGDAQLRFLRVVPRLAPFSSSLFREPLPSGAPAPVRLVIAGDDMATTILDLSRELKITLLALGEPPEEKRRARHMRAALSHLLQQSATPVLYVPTGARGPRAQLRRILLVVHLPYPATELAGLAIPLARRNQAEVMVLALPSAAPLISDRESGGIGRTSLIFPPFDGGMWLERECARNGCRTRALGSPTKIVDAILEQATGHEADLVVASAGLADLRVGWRRRKLIDVLCPRLPCPLLLGRCA